MENNLTEEKVNALTKLADLVGKKTLVMWCILTTFTTGYLFINNNELQNTRINEIKISNERLVEEIKGIKQVQKDNTDKIDSTIPKLDTTIDNVRQTLKKLKSRQ